MGFQFNHVGGGTKTRKPIALQMQYAADADEPRCFLQTTAGERAVTLEELQRHIEAENRALEAAGEFDGAEIIVRIQYRHCPNLLLIDTPGLLAPPTKDADGAAAADDDADADAAATPTDPRERRVQELVLSKIRGDELFVLCVEEASDWLHAPARDLVARVDPSLSRSIVVATKLDTKFAQFTGADDLRHFLAAPTLHRRHPRLLGGPFFTSVPAGRVGATADHAYSTNRAFQNALAEQQRRTPTGCAPLRTRRNLRNYMTPSPRPHLPGGARGARVRRGRRHLLEHARQGRRRRDLARAHRRLRAPILPRGAAPPEVRARRARRRPQAAQDGRGAPDRGRALRRRARRVHAADDPRRLPPRRRRVRRRLRPRAAREPQGPPARADAAAGAECGRRADRHGGARRDGPVARRARGGGGVRRRGDDVGRELRRSTVRRLAVLPAGGRMGGGGEGAAGGERDGRGGGERDGGGRPARADRRGARGVRDRAAALGGAARAAVERLFERFATSWIGCCWCTRSAARPPPRRDAGDRGGGAHRRGRRRRRRRRRRCCGGGGDDGGGRRRGRRVRAGDPKL